MAEIRGEARLDASVGLGLHQAVLPGAAVCCSNSIHECKHGRVGPEYGWAWWLCGQAEKKQPHLHLQKSPQSPAGTTGTCGDFQLNSGQEDETRGGILGLEG